MNEKRLRPCNYSSSKSQHFQSGGMQIPFCFDSYGISYLGVWLQALNFKQTQKLHVKFHAHHQVLPL